MPVLEERAVKGIDLDSEGAANLDGVYGVWSPDGEGHVAVRAGGEGAKQVYFSEKFKVIAPFGGTGFAIVLVFVGGESCDLKDVEDVVDVLLGEAVRGDSADEVGVAAAVEVLACEHFVDVGVAAGA